MKLSSLWIFAGLFIIVSIFYCLFGQPLFQVSPAATPPKNPVQSSDRLLSFDPDAQIIWIQIQKPLQKETVTLNLQNETWQLKYPVSYPADKVLAQGLVTALKLARKARRLMPEKDWEEYGLAIPDIKIGVQAQGSRARHYLLFGDYSPVADLVYARWEGEREYFLLDARLKPAFDRTAYSMREKRVVRFPLRGLAKIHVRTFTSDYELARKDQQWYWTKPDSQIGRNVEQEQMYEIFLALRDLNIKEFLDEQKIDGAQHGFSKESPRIQVWNEKKEMLTFFIGKEIVEHNAYYGSFENEKTLLEIAKPNIDNFFGILEAIGMSFPKPQPSMSEAGAVTFTSSLRGGQRPTKQSPSSEIASLPSVARNDKQTAKQ